MEQLDRWRNGGSDPVLVSHTSLPISLGSFDKTDFSDQASVISESPDTEVILVHKMRWREAKRGPAPS